VELGNSIFAGLIYMLKLIHELKITVVTVFEILLINPRRPELRPRIQLIPMCP